MRPPLSKPPYPKPMVGTLHKLTVLAMFVLQFIQGACGPDPRVSWRDADLDGVPESVDCDDNNSEIGGPLLWRPDSDGDCFGDMTAAWAGCEKPTHIDIIHLEFNEEAIEEVKFIQEVIGEVIGECSPGWVNITGDCNDNDPRINPEAEEDSCTEDVDENCNSDFSDGAPSPPLYPDTDEDGDGDASEGVEAFEGCSPPTEHPWSTNNSDCNDSDADLNSTTPWCLDEDGDNDGDPATMVLICNPQESEGAWVRECGDCDDDKPYINSLAEEVCDDIDNNCDGVVDGVIEAADLYETYYEDKDSDGFGNPEKSFDSCDKPEGYVDNFDDCNDNNSDQHPGTIWYQDYDADTYYAESIGSQTQCVSPGDSYSFLVTVDFDCNDNEADIHPGAIPDCGTGIDNDCDPTSCNWKSGDVYYFSDSPPPTAPNLSGWILSYEFGDIGQFMTSVRGSTDGLFIIHSLDIFTESEPVLAPGPLMFSFSERPPIPTNPSGLTSWEIGEDKLISEPDGGSWKINESWHLMASTSTPSQPINASLAWGYADSSDGDDLALLAELFSITPPSKTASSQNLSQYELEPNLSIYLDSLDPYLHGDLLSPNIIGGFDLDENGLGDFLLSYEAPSESLPGKQTWFIEGSQFENEALFLSDLKALPLPSSLGCSMKDGGAKHVVASTGLVVFETDDNDTNSTTTCLVVYGYGEAGAFHHASIVAPYSEQATIILVDLDDSGVEDLLYLTETTASIALNLLDGGELELQTIMTFDGDFPPPWDERNKYPAALGDFNGDGQPDLAVGRIGTRESQDRNDLPFYPWATHIYFSPWKDTGGSSPRLSPTEITKLNQAESAYINWEVGAALENVGDLDNDGDDELLVGAPNIGGISADRGSVFLFLGSQE